METIVINAGFANRWGELQHEIIHEIEEIIKNAENYDGGSVKNVGRGVNEYTYTGGGFQLIYKIDSTD